MKRLLPMLLLAAAAPQDGERIAAGLAAAHPGARFGLVVADADGREILALLPDQRFVPASNTKMFTTAAAFANLVALDQPNAASGTAVTVDGRDVVLGGRGDARLSSAPDCVSDCLADLADRVRAETRKVRDVIGDDSLFADERWSPGMSWNNIGTRSGTAVSALTLDDNEVALTVTPAARVGDSPAIVGNGYFAVENRATTLAPGEKASLSAERLPFARTVRISGSVAQGGASVLTLGIDDPAHYAAWRFADLLRARGVKVKGQVRVRHRTPEPPAPLGDTARLTAPPLIEDLTIINKTSQNLHAELLLRMLGLQRGEGTIARGLESVRAMFDQAGVPRTAYDFADGSGMSNYNRISPRGVVTFLAWAARQPWGEAWRATLATPGQGTLRRRFLGTPLEGRLWAKTGTLNATNALAGYLQAKSGRRLAFAFYANDVPGDASATGAMDRVLLEIAAAN
jgi:D-alanyl-D-alanine carboxypeptidase/D-alanyl-D-alanine-endopeptidase (penicillin-binding protein 4)